MNEKDLSQALDDATVKERGLKVLVLSVDIGAGHKRAAQAICETLCEVRQDSEYEVVEALDYLGAGSGKLAKDLYFGVLEEAPNLWGALYEGRELIDLLKPITSFIDDLQAGGLVPVVKDFKPDAILAMHPFAIGLGAALARNGDCDCPVIAVLTDFDGHPSWLAKGIDRYLVATESVAKQIRHLGPETGDIKVTGLPLRPAFESIRTMGSTKEKLGLDPAKLTILLLGGGLGLGPIIETAKALGKIDGPVELVLIAGGNKELKEEAEELARTLKVKLHVTGLVENMHEYMRAADVAISKPGGLTVAELLATGVPMIALSPIPGQEEANCDALLDEGVALEAASPEEAYEALNSLLCNPNKREEMRQKALQLGKPTAARVAARAVIEMIEKWPELRYHHSEEDGEDPFSLKSEAFRLFEKVTEKLEGLTKEQKEEETERSERERRHARRRREREEKRESSSGDGLSPKRKKKKKKRREEREPFGLSRDEELQQKFDEVEIDDELAELKRSLGKDD